LTTIGSRQPQGKTLNPDGNVVAAGACPAPAGAGNAALGTGPGPLLSSDYQTELVRNEPGALAAALAGCRLSGPPESRVTQQPGIAVGQREDGGVLPIPSGQESLTPGWLTDVLRQAGVISACRVVEARTEPAGQGQVAACFRCLLR
jgi:hypothetical protein